MCVTQLLALFPFTLLTWQNLHVDATHFSAYSTLVPKKLNAAGEEHSHTGCAAVNFGSQTSQKLRILHQPYPCHQHSQMTLHGLSLPKLFFLTLAISANCLPEMTEVSKKNFYFLSFNSPSCVSALLFGDHEYTAHSSG